MAGESYGSVYISTLALKIHEEGNINMKGFLIGNGVMYEEAGSQT
jgi:carboxypeptidase C (cathepsin A)